MNQTTQPKLGNVPYIPPNKRNGEVSPQKKTDVEITSGVGRIDIGGRKNAEPVVDMKKIKENKQKSPFFKLQPRVLTKPRGLSNEKEEKPTVSQDQNLIRRQISDKPRNGRNSDFNSAGSSSMKNTKTDAFSLKDFSEISYPYIDSHCHVDMIYNRLKCSFDDGLSKWMSNYQQSFNHYFIGCIPNFIEPHLFVNTQLTKDDYDMSWIIKELESNPLYLGATYGCHPHQVKSWADKEVFWDTLEILLPHKRSKCIAVGECGIDLNKCESPLDQQRYAFRRQIQLAFKYDKALVIHCRSGPNRDAESECLQILEDELNRPGQHRYLRIHRHCYTENWENAKRWIETCPNIVFGYTPAVFNFTGSQLDAIRNIPLDRIILETDAPYFVPSMCKDVLPRINLPGTAATVALQIAKYKNIPVGEVMRHALLNTRRIYSL